MHTSKIKQRLRATFGDRIISWIHAFRFLYLVSRYQTEYQDKTFAKNILRKGDITIDIGANRADWTKIFSKAVGSAGKVFAFEADPYYADVTRKTIFLMRLKNVIFFDTGLSNRHEKALLCIYDAENNRVSGEGYVVQEKDVSQSLINKSISINLIPLDDVASEYPIILQAKLIKCDVEGFELAVLEGAKNILRNARPIVILEIGHSHKHGYSNDELYYDSYVAVSGDLLRSSKQAGSISEGYRPNRIMIPREFDISTTCVRLDNFVS